MDQLPDHILVNKERQKMDSVRHKIRIMQAFIDGRPIVSKNRITEEILDEIKPKWDWSDYSYMISHPNYRARQTIIRKETKEPDNIVDDVKSFLFFWK